MAPATVVDATSIVDTHAMLILKLCCGYCVCGFLGALSFILLKLVWQGTIKLDALVAEINGQASASRFQLVIFTMIIALSLFVLTIQDGKFPLISPEILILLGISSSTYAVGKSIAFSQPGILGAAGEQATVQAISATGASAIATPQGIAAQGAPNATPPNSPPPPANPGPPAPKDAAEPVSPAEDAEDTDQQKKVV